MIIQKTPIQNAFILKPKKFNDNRGYFEKQFCNNLYKKKNLNIIWKQINKSSNKKKYTFRGMHFQKKPFTEIKIVQCIKGKILDVVIDLRKNSKTFGKTFKIILSKENAIGLYIPAGFGHAYYSYNAENIIYYKLDNYYMPKFESGIIYNDKKIKIKWPKKKIGLSKKDRNLGSFKDFCLKFKGL